MDDWSPETTLDPNSPLSETGTGPSHRLLAIYEVGRLLLEQREPRQIILTIHKALVDHLKPDHACVLSVGGNGSLHAVTAHDLDLDKPEDAWPISRTALRQAQETGLALLAKDVLQDPQFGGSQSVHKFSIGSVLCVPLGKDPVRGLIYADRRNKRDAFTREDLEFLTAISVYTGLVLERAEEYLRTSEALKRRDERLELLEREILRYEIVGKSPRLLESYDHLRRLAGAGARVLLRGETGTGKELFARAYAAATERGKPYVPVPIPALAPNLVESELFGHVKGAFTEASRDKKGYLEVAHGGVLFLDEIGDIEPATQVKLLRFLDSGELHRVGDTDPRHVDTLVVSATNRNLEKLVEEGRFRSDLLARLGHPIEIPPLRERTGDIPILVNHFNEVYCRGPKRKTFAPESMELMKRYPWEFNVRQLQQVVEHVVCLVDRETILPEDLPDFVRLGAELPGPTSGGLGSGDRGSRPLKDVIDEAERAHITQTLELTGGNKRKAIKLLGISSETFYNRLEEFGLHKKKS